NYLRGSMVGLSICVFVLMLVCLPEEVFGCSCLGGVTTQESFCQSKFVILGTILSKTKTEAGINNGYWVYSVKIQADYKGMGWKGKVIDIYTGPNTAACGVDFLEVGTRYVLMGYMQSQSGPLSKPRPFIGLCGYFAKASDVSKTEFSGFKKYYKPNCACKICHDKNSCQPGQCYLPKSNTYPEGRGPQCYRKNAICKIACHNNKGVPMCTWDLTKYWWGCMRQKSNKPCQDLGCF
ncbi:unnamed protein product, partial [Owenia fusiformis]